MFSCRLHVVLAAVLGSALLTALVLAGTLPATPADEGPPLTSEAREFFETHVRPVLANNCYSCHNKDAQLGGLRVDGRGFLVKGGDGGTALVPGNPDKSLLITAVRHTNTKLRMPQSSAKLKDTEIAALETWVKMGAPWPSEGTTAPAVDAASAAAAYTLSPAQKAFWSLQPVKKPTPPTVKNKAWAQTPIDAFVLATLEAKGLTPAPPADKRTLIRRASFDLTGLPPTPGEVAAFVSDKKPGAWARVIDRLLASPRYGERWARHWLDVARYADTKGYVFTDDRSFPNAYTFRDWVIDAFNRDLPYDQFVREQIAADRLPQVTSGDNKRPLAALGFLTVGRRFLNNQSDIIDDRIDVTMRGFQGLTVSCARCHDHKFDPIPTADYYSLYGVFASSVEAAPPISPKPISDPYVAHDARVKTAEEEIQTIITAETKALRERTKLEGASPLPDEVKTALQRVRENSLPNGKNLAAIETAYPEGARARLVALRDAIANLQKTYPAKPEFALALADAPKPVTPRIFKRGNSRMPGDEVPRQFLLALSPGGKRTPWTQGSGRLELARALSSKSNPLTARVFVNRVWLHHFGQGIVRTPSDFGKQGERPTHPALLDYLASTFMENGWRVKALHRAVMLSATYQQSSEPASPKVLALDPENRLLSRMNRRRLDLESLRDSLLWAGGKLDLGRVGGPSVDLWKVPFPHRRTVYGFIDRQNLPGVFRTFDFAGPDASVAQRFRTTVPQQALFLLNGSFAAEQARALAARVAVAAPSAENNAAKRINVLYQLLFNRLPDVEEKAAGLGFVGGRDTPGPVPPVSEPVWRYGYGFFDEAAQRVAAFTPLAHFVKAQWQGGASFPDAQLGFIALSAEGGHPGRNAQHAVVRRWTAPQTGLVSVKGALRHTQPEGDGVRGRVVSSRKGLVGEWVAHNTTLVTEAAGIAVEKGETLDFVVDCRASQDHDSFSWAPTIRPAGDKKTVWSAAAEFGGPRAPAPVPLTKWERYAQALLMTNEFTFVD